MRVFLDDVRETPEGFTHRAFNADEAITLLITGEVEFISLDHDLGDNCQICVNRDEDGFFNGVTCIQAVCTCPCHMTGYDVACCIEEMVQAGRIKMPGWACHSANPSGKKKIEAAMQSAEAFA